MCFYKPVVQSMFNYVVSENAPLVLILQSYPQIFIVLTLFGPGFIYRLKVQEVVFRDPHKISGSIQGSPVKLCTLIALLKVYQNT